MPCRLEHDGVELQVVADLADRRVLEQRLEPVERRAGVHLRGHVGARQQVAAPAPSPHGRAARSGLAVARGEGNPDDPGAHGERLVGNHAERELARRAEVGDQRVERVERRHERVVLLDRLGVGRVFVDQRAERQPGEQLVAALARRAAVAQRLEVDLERHVGPDRHQLAALQRVRRDARRASRGTSSGRAPRRCRAARRGCRTR